jgi:hypothetical protein
MELAGGQLPETSGSETTKLWYRCCKCKHSALLTITPSSQSKKAHAAAIDRELCTHYSKEKVYSIGEHIFHTELDDVGKVIRKDKMSNGIHSIVVNFEKLGERRLLENTQIESEEAIEQQSV